MEKKFAQRALKKLGFALSGEIEFATIDPKDGYEGRARHTESGKFIKATGARKLDVYDDLVGNARIFVEDQATGLDADPEDANPYGPGNADDEAAEEQLIIDAFGPSHATREAWLQAFVEASRPHFTELASITIPEKVRVSIGFASKGMRSKTIGECWTPVSSKDKITEIFIVPALQSEVSRIAGVLTHELVRACVGHEAKHGRKFSKPAKALGLEGKMTATTEGPEWFVWAQPILDALGPFPGAALTGELAGGKPKQSTRMLKLECDECGFLCRASKKMIGEHKHLRCPIETCGGQLRQEGAEDEDDGEE